MEELLLLLLFCETLCRSALMVLQVPQDRWPNRGATAASRSPGEVLSAAKTASLCPYPVSFAHVFTLSIWGPSSWTSVRSFPGLLNIEQMWHEACEQRLTCAVNRGTLCASELLCGHPQAVPLSSSGFTDRAMLDSLSQNSSCSVP